MIFSVGLRPLHVGIRSQAQRVTHHMQQFAHQRSSLYVMLLARSTDLTSLRERCKALMHPQPL